MQNYEEFSHGKTKLLRTDCMAFMATCKDKEFDLAIVDPPFGLDDMTKNVNGRHRHKITTYKNKSVPGNEYFKELERVSKHSIIWGCQYYIQQLNPKGSFIVWDKLKDVDACNLSSCDVAWYSKRERIRTFKGIWNGALKIDNEQTIHPHQKPVSLYQWLMHHYASTGMKLLDTHAGSFSIGIAAYNYDYDLTACELDPDYFQASVKRFKSHIAQTKIEFQ